MSLLFDQNLSRRLPTLLASEFPGSEHIFTLGMADANDVVVWPQAQVKGLAIASRDGDLRDLATRPGPPPQISWLRVGHSPTRVVEMLLRSDASSIRAFLANPMSPFLELS